MRELSKNVALLIASTIVAGGAAFVLAEVLLTKQYNGWKAQFRTGKELAWGNSIPSKNPKLLWEFAPNSFSKAHGVPIHTNQFGFRDRDYSVTKPEGVRRIAFIGDSLTLGLFAEEPEIFVRKFEDYARRLHPEIQAMNFGIDGYNIEQTYELLRSKVTRFSPDKVIYVMCLNDFDFDDASGQKILYFKKPRSFVEQRLRGLFRPKFSWKKDVDSLTRNSDYHMWHFENKKAEVFSFTRDMHRFLQQRGIEFQVILMPIFYFGHGNTFSKYPLSGMHRDIDNFFERNGIAYLDLLNAFSKQSKRGKEFAFDVWHPNAVGHAFIADQLFQDLLNHATPTAIGMPPIPGNPN
jgi:lysophospholipase L1-like esterase